MPPAVHGTVTAAPVLKLVQSDLAGRNAAGVESTTVLVEDHRHMNVLVGVNTDHHALTDDAATEVD